MRSRLANLVLVLSSVKPDKHKQILSLLHEFPEFGLRTPPAIRKRDSPVSELLRRLSIPLQGPVLQVGNSLPKRVHVDHHD